MCFSLDWCIMRVREILCGVFVFVIVFNFFVCYFFFVVVNFRLGNIYYVFWGLMFGLVRSLVVKIKINFICVEKCGDKYYMCSVEICLDEDVVCN